MLRNRDEHEAYDVMRDDLRDDPILPDDPLLDDEGFYEMPTHEIAYSEKYFDYKYEYRHVILPGEIADLVPERLMTEAEWKELGIRQSNGWQHYMRHHPG